MHRTEIRALTGLRGVAAILVASYHYTGFGLTAPVLIAPLVRHGYLGVDLFFALSGYVMALTYGHLFETGTGPYRSFLRRRLQRIYPLYAVCVLATFVLVGSGVLQPLSASANSVARLGIDLLLLQCLGAGPSLLPVSWSLSTEWIAYLAFPLLARAALHGATRAAWSMAAVCLAVLWALCEVPDTWLHGLHYRGLLHQSLGHVDTATPYPLLRCLAGFCLGMLAWRGSCSPRVAAAFGTPGAVGGVSLACIAVLWAPWADFVVVPCFAWLLLCLGSSPNPARAGPARWLASAPVHWLGKVSYSLYLTHLLLWQAMHSWLDRLGLPQLLLLVPALLLAALCYTAIEQPGRRLLAPWGGRNLV